MCGPYVYFLQLGPVLIAPDEALASLFVAQGVNDLFLNQKYVYVGHVL